jgi:transposase InsO family protein
MADHMRAVLVGSALDEAVGTRGGDVAGVVSHSDRGAQYTSGEFAELCDRHGVVQSVGRTGVCWDNAPAASFLATLKKELVYRRTFRTRAEVSGQWGELHRLNLGMIATLSMVGPYGWASGNVTPNTSREYGKLIR